MIVWTLLWLWFKIEFVVDLDTRKDFLIALTPNINISWTTKDNIGFRTYQFGVNFLNTSFNVNFYFPSCYLFDTKGQLVGKRTFPTIRIEEFHFDNSSVEASNNKDAPDNDTNTTTDNGACKGI